MDDDDAMAVAVIDAAIGVVEIVAPEKGDGVRAALEWIRARLEELHQREQARLN